MMLKFMKRQNKGKALRKVSLDVPQVTELFEILKKAGLPVEDVPVSLEEDSIIWFGVAPPAAHNYIVVRKADSKNGILYALQEVTVT